MKNLVKIATIAAIWFAPFWLSLIGGCTEEQLTSADRIITDVNDLASGGKAFMESPAGGTIPQPARGIAEVALALITAGAITWQQNRYKIMKKTTRAIVKGIESAEKETKPNPTNRVKAAVKTNLQAAGIYNQGDELIRKLVSAR